MSGHGLPRSIPDVYARLDALEGGGASVEWDNIEDKPNFATVATSGDYGDLSNAPTLGTAAAADIGDFATAAQGATADSAVQPGDLAAVATSGSYADLTNTPTLGTAAAANVGAAVPDVSDPPTQAEVNALLASLRTAGLIAT